MEEITDEQKNVLRSVFANLSDEQRSFIMSAFDKSEAEVIEYEPGKVLGCHLTQLDNYIIQVKTDYWIVGLIKNPGTGEKK